MATSGDASLRNGADAVDLAGGHALVGKHEPTTLDTLAAAYAEAGRFPDAVQTARQALILAQQQGRHALVKSIEEKLPLVRSTKTLSPTADHAAFRIVAQASCLCPTQEDCRVATGRGTEEIAAKKHAAS